MGINCMKVPKDQGEPNRRVLIVMELLDSSKKIASNGVDLFLPLVREPTDVEMGNLRNLGDVEFLEYQFEEHEKAPTLEDLLGFMPHYEVIGDIALIEADDIDAFRIGEELLKFHPHVNTVLGATSPVVGEFRVREFMLIAGLDKTETIHKEYGCRYAVDLAKAYFTPRLSTERERILSWIKPDDVIVDMFAGVGPYSILIAKKANPKKVIAIDKNPAAVEFLRRNIDLNSVENVEVIEGDANVEAQRFAGIADHVIMNLPHNAYDFLDSAVKLTRPGGIIHYYGMTHEDDLFDGSIGLIGMAAKRTGRMIEVLEKRTIRSYAPHQYNICIEIRVI
ncbi:MAG: class I SAM-dependent methyltransferase family protein [Methanosarcinaceae archaeon]|nr:class I SAM-dependent methyltransferase family protein [Methanosarcinaceae archaeon]